MRGDLALASKRREAARVHGVRRRKSRPRSTVHEMRFMKELGRLVREPTLAESVAIRDAVAGALVGLGVEVTRVGGTALEFHMRAPLKTRQFNPLFVVTGGSLSRRGRATAHPLLCEFPCGFVRTLPWPLPPPELWRVRGQAVLVAVALAW